MECNCCRGRLAFLGILGHLYWFICVNCGSQQSIDSVVYPHVADEVHIDE